MDQNLLYLSLIFLTFCTLLNVRVNIKLLKKVRQLSDLVSDTSEISPGIELPQITAKTLERGKIQDLMQNNYATVLLFLSAKCPKCKEKLAEIQSIARFSEQSGVRIWLLSTEPKWRVKRFLGNTELSSHAVFLTEKDYRKLNLKLVSPYYLFVDPSRQIEAEGMIGDTNWQSFVVQMNELNTTEKHEN